MWHTVKQHTRALVRWGPVLACMAAIFLVSGRSDAQVPDGLSDKAGHMIAYAGLGLLAVHAVAGGLPARMTWRLAASAFAVAVGYGISDEIHQSFVPGRTADVYDVIADAAGALTAVAACWAWSIIQLPTPSSRRPDPKPQ